MGDNAHPAASLIRMTVAAKKPTPKGTWPLLISGVLLLLTTPAYFLGQVVPGWLAIVGAVLFLTAAVVSLVWSYILLVQLRGSSARGIPIAGVAIGVISVVLAAMIILPAAVAR